MQKQHLKAVLISTQSELLTQSYLVLNFFELNNHTVHRAHKRNNDKNKSDDFFLVAVVRIEFFSKISSQIERYSHLYTQSCKTDEFIKLFFRLFFLHLLSIL